MNNIPDGFEVVQPSNVPDGFEVVDTQDKGLIQQAGLDTMNALKYNASKAGALINAGLANVNEAVGVDSSMFRDNQAWYQDSAKNADVALNKTYGDGIMKTMVKEAGNPINYVGGGLKSIAPIVGANTAGEIATHSDRSGANLQDVSKVADDASIGLVGGKIIDGLLGVNPKRALLGDDANTPNQISDIKALADKHGIKLTPATTTGSANLARLEHSINDGIAGGLGMRQALNAEKKSADNAIINQLESMGANGSNINAGETFTKNVDEVIRSEKEYFKDAFGNLFAKYGDKPIFSIRGVKQEAQKLVDQAETIPLIKNSTAYRDSKAILESADDLTWNDWSKLRTHLGGLTQDGMSTGKASTGAYKNMYSKLEGDLKSSVNATGDRDVLNKYNEIIDEYKAFKNGFDGRGSGARFINSLTQGKVNPETVGHIMNNSSLKAKGAINAGGFDSATGIPNAKKVSATDTLFGSKAKNSDELSLNNFTKYSDRAGFKEVAKQPSFKQSEYPVLDPYAGSDVIPLRAGEAIENTANVDNVIIDDLREIAKAITRKDNYKNTSKTAQYNMLNALKVMSPVEIAKYIIKDVGLSVAYRNEMFQKWLEKGILSRAEYQTLMKLNKPRNSAIRNTAINSLLGSDDKNKTSTSKLGLIQ